MGKMRWALLVRSLIFNICTSSFTPLSLSHETRKQARTQTNRNQEYSTANAAYASARQFSIQNCVPILNCRLTSELHSAHHNHFIRLPKIPTTTHAYILVTNATVMDDIVTRNFHLFATMPHYNLFTTNATTSSYFSADVHNVRHMFIEHSPQP